jgi:hypothetical protein
MVTELLGAWAGTNGFRLMPGDSLHESPATAFVSTAAGGHLTLIAYAWQHPDDGPQDGLLLIGSTGEGDALTATWGDSWHQQRHTGKARRAVSSDEPAGSPNPSTWAQLSRLDPLADALPRRVSQAGPTNASAQRRPAPEPRSRMRE